MRSPILEDKKILYAIVDPAQISSRHPLLFKKMFDLTLVLTQRLSTILEGDVMYFESIDSAMAHGRFSDLIVIQSIGNFVLEYRFLEELEKFCRLNPKVFLLAFPPTSPVNESDPKPLFNSSLMVVNVRTWENLGCPGLDEGKTPSQNSSDQDSRENLPQRTVHGCKFFDALISQGLTYLSFPESFRSYTLYISPEFETARLYLGLVTRDESTVSHPEQKKWIRLIAPRSTIWVFNSEPYRFDMSLRHCDVYFGPAAGFKYLDMLSHNPRTKFLFYDNNVESLEWIRMLRLNWDGGDYAGYLSDQPENLRELYKFVNCSIAVNQQMLLDEFGGEQEFKRLWNIFRSAEVRLFRCDLFDSRNVCELISNVEATHPLFYYSNVFSTNFTMTIFSRECAEERYEQFRSVVRKRFPKVILHGADIDGRWQ